MWVMHVFAGLCYMWLMHVYVGLCTYGSFMCVWICLHMGHAWVCRFVYMWVIHVCVG